HCRTGWVSSGKRSRQGDSKANLSQIPLNSIQILASLTVGCGVLICALAIPLVLRRVPPNGIYGIRTKASFASESDWYRINSIGGRYLAVSGLIISMVGVA